jgi:hypothetical protein
VGQCVKVNDYYVKFGYSTYTPPTSSSADKACFAGSETLHLESGEVRAISDVRVGDRVLSADAAGRTSYSDVVYVPHRANSDDALFTHITTASGRDIKMTLASDMRLISQCGRLRDDSVRRRHGLYRRDRAGQGNVHRSYEGRVCRCERHHSVSLRCESYGGKLVLQLASICVLLISFLPH